VPQWRKLLSFQRVRPAPCGNALFSRGFRQSKKSPGGGLTPAPICGVRDVGGRAAFLFALKTRHLAKIDTARRKIARPLGRPGVGLPWLVDRTDGAALGKGPRRWTPGRAMPRRMPGRKRPKLSENSRLVNPRPLRRTVAPRPCFLGVTD